MVEEKKDSVLRRKRKQGFTMINNSVLDSPDLSLKAKGLFCHLQSKATITGWRFSKDNLLKNHKDGRKALEAAINELKKFGLLKIQRVQNKQGKFTGWEWILEDNLSKPTKRPNELK